jgi:pimeloyl-ACP methyl ester carboxylesterase
MDLRPVIPSITAPTLVIAATEDPATPPWQAAQIARAVPGARLSVIRGTSHLANYQTPGRVTVELSAHLAPLL